MELWIRSQDKMTLVNVYNLYVIERDFAKNDSIWWEIYCNDEISLGLYIKDRAEEILDEIQRLITDLQYMSYAIPNDKFAGYRPNVYEMPKE